MNLAPSVTIKVVLVVVSLMISGAGGAEAKIVTHCQGSGEPIYLVGGGPAFTTWNLQPVLQHLAMTYKVCRWDMRGIGDNAALPVSNKQSLVSQWLSDMKTTLPKEPVILWGHSWGALQVLLFASAHPARVDRIVLSNPVDPLLLSLENIENKRYIHAYHAPRINIDMMGTSEEKYYLMREKIASYFVDGKTGWDYAEHFSLQDSNSAYNVRAWEEYRADRLTDQEVHRLGKKVSGILYCDDDVLQPENQKEYTRLIQDRVHYTIDNCAHFPWVENPVSYYKALDSILSSKGG